MKYLVWLLLISACIAQEIKRPTADVDGGAIAGLGCNGTNKPSTGMSLSYDSAGLSTRSTQSFSPSTNGFFSVTRVFKNWQSTGNTYSSLSLNVNAFSSGWQTVGGKGSACVLYSTNSGTTWTSLGCDDAAGDGFAQTTFGASLSATQNLANLRVAVCVGGFTSKVNFGGDDLTIWDIWTTGTTAAGPTSGNGSTVGSPHRAVVIVN